MKAQIHAGGRGKGKFKEAAAGDKGGVRIAKSIEEVKQFATEMLGNTLVTIQTGPAGRVVKRLFIEDGCDIGASSTFPRLSTARRPAWPSSLRRKAAWISRKWPMTRPRRS